MNIEKSTLSIWDTFYSRIAHFEAETMETKHETCAHAELEPKGKHEDGLTERIAGSIHLTFTGMRGCNCSQTHHFCITSFPYTIR